MSLTPFDDNKPATERRTAYRATAHSIALEANTAGQLQLPRDVKTCVFYNFGAEEVLFNVDYRSLGGYKYEDLTAESGNQYVFSIPAGVSSGDVITPGIRVFEQGEEFNTVYLLSADAATVKAEPGGGYDNNLPELDP